MAKQIIQDSGKCRLTGQQRINATLNDVSDPLSELLVTGEVADIMQIDEQMCCIVTCKHILLSLLKTSEVVGCNFTKNKNFRGIGAVPGYHFDTGIQFTLQEEIHLASIESVCTTNLYSS
jgi:hypothetical protein